MGLFSECKQMVKYSGTLIEIATVKGSVQLPAAGGVSIKAVSMFPYLLQAISEKEPFDIERSVKSLSSDSEESET